MQTHLLATVDLSRYDIHMSASTLQTKLYIPPVRREYVPRPRLNELLDSGLSSKLILLSAPAGYGKTALLSEWTSRLDLPCAWLSLDRYDNDLGRFLEYLLASIEKSGVEITIHPSTPPQIPNGLDTSFLVSLINDLSTLDPSLLLILDDYHRIQNEQVHSTVAYLLENLPPKVSLVITTRIDPPLRLAKLRARGWLCEIRADELRFTEGEAIAFLNQTMKLGIQPSDIAALTWKTEGWITGLQLAAISLKDNPEKGAFINTFAGDDRHIADYLVDEALTRQSPVIQEFLLKTAILDRYCAALCNDLTGKTDAREILNQLEQSNIFLIPLDNVREWYRYHHLFQDLLRNRLHQRYTSGVIKSLQLQASDWYLDKGMLFEAIQHAYEAEDMLRIARLVENQIFSLLDQGGIRTLSGWIDSIPSDIKVERPFLCIANALLKIYIGDLNAGESALVQAEQGCSQFGENESLHAKGFISTIRAYAHWMKGESREAGLIASQALQIIPEEEKSLKAFALMVLGGAQINNNEVEAPFQSLNQSITLAQNAKNHHTYILASSHLIFHLIQQGRLSQADQLCQDILDAYEGLRREISPAIAQIYTLKGDIHAKRMELDQALDNVNKGLEISKRWGQIDTLTLSYIYLIDILITRGALNQAMDVLVEVKSLSMEVSTWFREIIEETEARIQLYVGNIETASRWADANMPKPSELLSPTHRNAVLTHARIWMAKGRFSEAEQLLNRLIDEDGENIPPNQMIITTLLKCLVLLEFDQEEEAFKLFSTTLQQAEPEQNKITFVRLGKPLLPLLRKAIETGFLPTFALEIMEDIMGKDSRRPKYPNLTSHKDELVLEQLLEPLSHREIEVLVWMAEGCTNQEIAQELVLSLHTVKSHARNIYGKLGVKNRTEAVNRARLLAIID